MLRVEELGVALVKVISQVGVRDVGKVQEFEQIDRLLLDQVVVNAQLLGYGVLGARIVQKLLLWH